MGNLPPIFKKRHTTVIDGGGHEGKMAEKSKDEQNKEVALDLAMSEIMMAFGVMPENKEAAKKALKIFINVELYGVDYEN